MEQRQKDVDFKNSIIEKIAKIEYDKDVSFKNLERARNDLEFSQKEIGQLENNKKFAHKKYKTEKENFIFERDGLLKQISRINYRDHQIQHALKKKELENDRIKDQLKKSSNFEKKIKNFEISKNLKQDLNENNDNNNTLMNYFHQKYANYNKKLLKENLEMRNTLGSLQNNLNDVMNKQKNEYVCIFYF